MDVLNAAIEFCVSLMIRPFALFPPGVALTAAALVSSVFFMLVFKHTSNQRAVRRVRDRIGASMIEIRLFQHDLGVVFRAQWRILIDTLLYLRYALIPLFVLFLPFAALVAHLDCWFGSRPLAVREKTVLSVDFARGADVAAANLRLEVPHGLIVESPAVYFADSHQAVWRLRAVNRGGRVAKIFVDGREYEKTIVVGGRRLQAVSRRRVGDDIAKRFTNPLEPALGSGPVEEIGIDYPRREGVFYGLRVHWSIPFVALMIVFGLALKGVLRVEV